MGNAVGSFFSGFAQVVGNNLGHPLDFLSGKSCNSVCGSTWDILCYIENFCVAHLLKLGMVATLSYFALDFFCTYLCFKLRTVRRKRRRRKRDLKEFAATSDENCELGDKSETQHTTDLEHRRSQVSKRRDYKNEHLRRSLRPRSHRPLMKLSGGSIHLHRRKILNNFGDQGTQFTHIFE
ncbi:UNVERIFIED_CONTAM: hypothetical protein Sindi_1416300 [Sesamum indicum]